MLTFSAKCRISRTYCNDRGVKVDPTKIEAKRNWPVPTNVTELRGFIGLCSYYRKFIRSFAKIARPIHSLLEKRQYVGWLVGCFED